MKKTNAKRNWMPWLKRIVSLVVVFAVAITAWKAIQQLDSQLGQQELEWSNFNFWMAAAATLSYFLAMCCGWLYWHRVLVAMNQRPVAINSFRAFFFSQLAKYIPGKAMVVVVRTATVCQSNVKPGAAVVSVFVETLTWISVASFIAVLMLFFYSSEIPALESISDNRWQAASIVLLLITAVPTFPPVNRRLIKLFSGKRLLSVKQDVNAGINLRTWGFGWIVMLVGWCFNAASLWLVLNSIPAVEAGVSSLPLCLLAVSLATVIGFVSFLPGGLGVRELVMIPLLGPVFGATQALAAAIVLRLVWLATEIAVASFLKLFERISKRKDDSQKTSHSRIAA